MKLGKVLHVDYYLLNDFYLPFTFTVENPNGGEPVVLQPNQIYCQFEDILYRNVILGGGDQYPVPYRFDPQNGIDVPLVDEVLAMEKRSDDDNPPAELLATLRTYINCLKDDPNLQKVTYEEYMQKVYDPNCFSYVPEYLREKAEPLDIVGGAWDVTPVNTTQESEPQVSIENNNPAEVKFETLTGMDSTSNEYQIVSGYSVQSKEVPVGFIPTLRKYEQPIPYVVRNMSSEEFQGYIFTLSNTKDRTQQDQDFIKDLLRLLAVQNPEAIDPDTYLSVFSSGRGCELLYEMLKYERVTESPNGLYNNMYYVIYLLHLACKDINLADDEIEGTVLYLLTYLCCNIKQLNITDSGDKDDAVDDSGIASVSTTAELEMNFNESNIYNGLQALNDLIYHCLISGNIHFKSFLADIETLNPIQKLCLSARYNLCVYLESDIQRQLSLDVLNFTLGEFFVKLSFCGIDVAPTCVGEAIYLSTKKDTSVISQQTQTSLVELESTSRTNLVSYNEILKSRKQSPEYCRLTGLSRFKEIEDPRKLTLELYKMIVLSYEVNGKKRNEPYGLIVTALDENGAPRYNVLPLYSSVYNELEMLGLQIHFTSKDQDHLIPLKSVYGCTASDGTDVYALLPVIKEINTLNQTLQEHIYMTRVIGYEDRKETFTSLNSSISLLRKPHKGTNERPLLLSLPPFITKDITHIEEALKRC